MPVRGRLWKLDYRHGMGATWLGGARAIDGHCGGGVGGMCGASGEMRVATRRSLYAHVYKHNTGALLSIPVLGCIGLGRVRIRALSGCVCHVCIEFCSGVRRSV